MSHPDTPIQQALDLLAELDLPDETRQQLTTYLTSASDELAAAHEEKAKFVSVVTHELRIPMTSIQGYTDLMRQEAVGPVTDQQKEFLGVIRNNVERMSALVGDLSDISKLEAGRLVIDPAPLPLYGYVEEVLKDLRPQMEAKGQVLEVDVPEDLPRVVADPQRLQQIIANLLRNAHLYSSEDKPIQVKALEQNGFVRLEVMDQGVGIGEEDQQHIFQQFFRSDDAAVREEPGWGLGLRVAKLLTEAFDGHIGFESQLGAGSTFWVELPIDK
ncbi:MAG: HAMP domain-containing histidine kinase [Chloroflexi bacterium]|nr:HAMP domain-containing histidine kinase [Chloroflexota bacterium]